MKKLLKWLLSFYRKEKPYRYVIVEDLPNKIEPGTLYIFANNGYYWQIAMFCPCGCKTVLYMNLVDDITPFWKYHIDHNNLISISPSLHRKTGCKSHFFLRKGKIVWC
jgi:hypothetical protein